MKEKTLKSGFSIPVLGLGTRQIGGNKDADFSKDQEYIDDIKRALDLGINLIDTAEVYGNGHTEELIGAAIKEYDRQKLFITSKVYKTHLKYDDIITAAKHTLDRLGTNYLDLYLVHAIEPDTNLQETMEAMNHLLETGLIKNIGVCNFRKETLALAQSFSKAKIVLNQCHYSLLFREPDSSGLITYCQDNDIIMQAWRPFQFGEIINSKNTVMDEISQKYHKSYAQTILNWLISQDNVTTITKMTKSEHIIDNIGSIDWQMEQEDIILLKEKYPNQQNVSNLVPLM